MKKIEVSNKLAKYLSDNLSSEEGYRRGETNLLWKGHQWINISNGISILKEGEVNLIYLVMAKDIIKLLKLKST